jgi:hypothetical protein
MGANNVSRGADRPPGARYLYRALGPGRGLRLSFPPSPHRAPGQLQFRQQIVHRWISTSALEHQNSEKKVYSIPATRLAEELGKRMVLNSVMVGFFTAGGH